MVDCSCVLCGGVHLLTRPTYMVNSYMNCAEIAIDLCMMDRRDCFSALQFYNEDCCTYNNTGKLYDRSDVGMYVNVSLGPYAPCWLCRKTNRKPTVKSMVINILTLQAGSCVQYYEYGRLGYIAPHICSALQALAKVPCGC